MMKEPRFCFRRFLKGITAGSFLTPLPFTPYPFAFPEKALTFDWDNVGEDINVAIMKCDKKHDRE